MTSSSLRPSTSVWVPVYDGAVAAGDGQEDMANYQMASPVPGTRSFIRIILHLLQKVATSPSEGLLMIFIGWPDPTFMECLIFAFPSVGFSPHVPVHKAQPAECITESAILSDAWADADRLVKTLRSRDHDEAIVEAGQDDEALGVCGPALSWAQLCEQVPHFRLIRASASNSPVANSGSSTMRLMAARVS